MQLNILIRMLCILSVSVIPSCGSKEGSPSQSSGSPAVHLSTDINVQPGYFFEYQFRKTKSINGSPVENGAGPVRVEILEVTSEGAIFTYHQIIEVPQSEKDTLLGELMRAGDFVMEWRATKNWKEFELLNLDELMLRFVEIARITMELRADSIPSETAEAGIRMMTDPTFVYATVMEPISQFFFISGHNGVEGEMQSLETSYESPFGGGDLPSTLQVVLSRTMMAGEVQAHITEKYHSGSMNPILEDALSSFSKNLEIEIPSIHLETTKSQMKDLSRGIFDSNLGFITESIFLRKISVEDLDGNDNAQHNEMRSWNLIAHGKISSIP